MIEDNKKFMQRFVEEVINKKNLDSAFPDIRWALESLLTEDSQVSN